MKMMVLWYQSFVAFQPSEFGIKFNNIIAVPQPMYSESGSGVVEAKILRPRPQPSRPRPRPQPSRPRPRPGPSRSRPRPGPSRSRPRPQPSRPRPRPGPSRSRPRPQPSRPRPRPGPSRSRPRPGPEAKTFKHTARAEMNIHSYIWRPDRIGNKLNFDCFSLDIQLLLIIYKLL